MISYAPGQWAGESTPTGVAVVGVVVGRHVGVLRKGLFEPDDVEGIIEGLCVVGMDGAGDENDVDLHSGHGGAPGMHALGHNI